MLRALCWSTIRTTSNISVGGGRATDMTVVGSLPKKQIYFGDISSLVVSLFSFLQPSQYRASTQTLPIFKILKVSNRLTS